MFHSRIGNMWSSCLEPTYSVGMRGLWRTVEPLKGPARRRHTLCLRGNGCYMNMKHMSAMMHGIPKGKNTHLSSCRCFNSLSSNSRLNDESSQRSMSLSLDTFSSSARNRTTSFVKSIVAMLTTIDNHYRHSTSLVTNQCVALTNHTRAF